MCLERRNLSPKARRFLALGNLCLLSFFTLSFLGKDFSHAHFDLYDGLRGFLIGLSITFNFAAFRFANRCPPKDV
jgi:hypothetical protein